MPGIRTATSILELKGSYRKNPQRRRSAEPVAAPFRNTPPSHLTAAQKKIWRAIVKDCADGVITQSDRLALEQLTMLVSEWRENPKDFKTSRHALMHSCLARFGMTPCDRSKIIVPKVTANKFSRRHAE